MSSAFLTLVGVKMHAMGKNLPYSRVAITRTEGEWEEIKKRIKELGKSDLNGYLRGEISKLQRAFNECPICMTPASGKPITKQHCVSKDIYADLVILAKKMNRPVNSVIEDFFIVPLLLPETVWTLYPSPSTY